MHQFCVGFFFVLFCFLRILICLKLCVLAEINAPGMIPLKVPLKRSSMTGKAKGGNRGSVVDVVVFTWSGQGVDEGPDAATWWSTYLGCNARFVRFDSGTKTCPLFFFFCYLFLHENKAKCPLSVMTLWAAAKHGLHHSEM
jgi:hypothetical protein